jgi:hypothetical protein
METTPEVSCTNGDTASVRLNHGKGVDVKATASEPSSSDDDGDSSDSDPGPSGVDDGDSSEADEQRRSSTTKYSAWSELDEQRLLAYKKEGKSWSWIFRKFPCRTPGEYARA